MAVSGILEPVVHLLWVISWMVCGLPAWLVKVARERRVAAAEAAAVVLDSSLSGKAPYAISSMDLAVAAVAAERRGVAARLAGRVRAPGSRSLCCWFVHPGVSSHASPMSDFGPRMGEKGVQGEAEALGRWVRLARLAEC